MWQQCRWCTVTTTALQLMEVHNASFCILNGLSLESFSPVKQVTGTRAGIWRGQILWGVVISVSNDVDRCIEACQHIHQCRFQWPLVLEARSFDTGMVWYTLQCLFETRASPSEEYGHRTLLSLSRVPKSRNQPSSTSVQRSRSKSDNACCCCWIHLHVP